MPINRIIEIARHISFCWEFRDRQLSSECFYAHHECLQTFSLIRWANILLPMRCSSNFWVSSGRAGTSRREGGFVHCRENEDLRKSPGIGPNCPSMMAIMEVKFYWLKHRPRSSKYTSLVETPDLPSDFPGYEILGLSDGAKSVLWSYRHHTHWRSNQPVPPFRRATQDAVEPESGGRVVAGCVWDFWSAPI